MTALRVLIVDDDRDFVDGMAEFLKLCGHSVETAFTGERGITAAGRDTFDAVLMDIGLPGLDGVESLLRIKRDNPLSQCFLLTGFSKDHIAEQYGDAGGIETLTKPIDPEALSRRLFGPPIDGD